jgi:hypothetical protein
LLVLASLAASAAIAGTQFVYPMHGQSAEKQQTDEAQCSDWAKSKTGYDPAQAQAAASAAQPASATSDAAVNAVLGQLAGGAGGGVGAAGAALGGVSGGLPGQLGGAGGGAGAALTGLAGQIGNSSTAQTQSAAAQHAAELDANYYRARSACLEARGYSVK